MVTQDVSVVPRVNKVKMKKMKKKKSKKKIKAAENLDSESEADKVDLDDKIYPLSHYITDQEELVNQMFLTIRGSKLEAMLPPVLKSIPVKELKRLCLHELRGMSKKRILCCINGQVMEGSSGSEDEEEEKEEANEEPNRNETNSKGEKRKPNDEQPPDYLQKKIKVEPGTEDSTGSREKSVLELLELEMRARIIKTMLEKGDDGKKITEDAIAAVMKSAKKITSEGTGGSDEMASAVAETKDDSQKLDRETGSENEAAEERSTGRRRGEGKRGDRKGYRDSAHDGRRSSGGRSQRRRDGNYSDDGSRGRSSRKQKECDASKTHIAKKKKITRKEFEERMKRAKKNRTYRQRKSSEDEEKAKENEKTENTKEDQDEKDGKVESKADKEPDAPAEGNNIQEKADGEGEVSEKEEGEIDSNEEEEGACSPSDISSSSRYSSSRSSSRSWSRSYTRSLSRSPHRGRQRRNSRRTRSRSRSRSRRKRRSYSRSYSRSRTPERRRRGDHQPRSFERRGRDSPKPNSKKDVKKTSLEDISPSREEDWGHKCDIEFVDSEEDFDDNPEAAKKDLGAPKTLPVNRIERASISFSLQKKPVGIAQSVDLDDLPLKKKLVSDDIEAVSAVKPTTKSEEIVISSDSEAEVQPSIQRKKTSEQLATTAGDPKLLEFKMTDQSLVKENITLQSDQEKKSLKKAVDSESKSEESTKEFMGGNTEDSRSSTGLNQEVNKENKSSDRTKMIQNVNNENMEAKKGKQTVEKVDKTETGVDINKGESVDDSRDSENTDDSGNVELDRDNTHGNRKISTRKLNIPYDTAPVKRNTRKTSTDSIDGASVVSRPECKEKGVDDLEKDKTQRDVAGNSRAKDIEGVEDYDSEISGRKGTDSELNVDTEESSDKETRQIIQQRENVKDKPCIQPSEEEEEEERDVEVTDSDQTVNIKLQGKRVKKGHASIFLKQKVERSEILTTNEQKDAEPESKEVTSIFEGQSEEEFYLGTEQFSEDEKDNEDTGGRRSLKEKTHGDSLRAEAGFTCKQVKTHQKIEMVMPERSWMKRDRRKGEKAKGFLGMERTGLMKSAPAESAQGEGEAETSQKTKAQESIGVEEIQAHSPVLVSDTENSQPTEESGQQNQASSSPNQDLVEVSHTDTEDRARKTDHDTEIIGVIETSKDTSENFDDLGTSSWSMRWLQSEKVQKVVTNSKMLSRVRKKIQWKEKAKVVMAEKVEDTHKPAEPVIPVIGSIEEYERLFGTKVKKDEASIAGSEVHGSAGEGQVSSGASQDDISASKPRGNPVFGSDDDGEDSEDEALWSKIIKK